MVSARCHVGGGSPGCAGNNFRTSVCRRACTSTRRRYRSCSWRTSRCVASCAVSRQHAPVKCTPRWWHVWRPSRRSTRPWRGTPTPSVGSTSGAWTTSPTRWSALSYRKRFIAMLTLPPSSSRFISCRIASSPNSPHPLRRRRALHEGCYVHGMLRNSRINFSIKSGEFRKRSYFKRGFGKAFPFRNC